MKHLLIFATCLSFLWGLLVPLVAAPDAWAQPNTREAGGFGGAMFVSPDLALNEPPSPRGPRVAVTEAAPALKLSGNTDEAESPVYALGGVGDLSSYSPEIQNIVRACDGDIFKIFDLIRNHVEFQPYFGFRKSPEHTWQTLSGNDADQAFLLVQCLRAAGYEADFEYGVVFMPKPAAINWFGAENATGLSGITGSGGYFGGNAGPDFYALEQIWCLVRIDGVYYELAPAYKEHEVLPGIDLEAAMNYSSTSLLAAADGVETAIYSQGVDETAVNAYLAAKAMSLVSTLKTTHPNASTPEIVGGRRILASTLADDFSNGFYADGSFIDGSFDNFIFSDPYGDYVVDGEPTRFYAFLSFAVGEIDPSGTAFVSAPFIVDGGPSGFFTGRKISLNFDEEFLAEYRVDDVLIEAETGTPGSAPIGFAFSIQHPFDRGAGTVYDELRVRPVERGGLYTYVFDAGRSGREAVTLQRKRIMATYQRSGLGAGNPAVLSETLHLLGLDWIRQYSLATELMAQRRNFVPILHHIFILTQQEEGVGVDVPAQIVPIPKDGVGDYGADLRALLMVGSAMEHGVIEQNNPGINAVSTVRYLRENNALGNKTYFATSANYSSVTVDPDFTAGWSSVFRNGVFPSALSQGKTLIIPQSGALVVDDLAGNGYFKYDATTAGATINPGALKGGYSTTAFLLDFELNPFPLDPTPGPKLLKNPESPEPIDMLTGAYVFDGTDLRLSGSGVRGLAFTRHYSSLAASANQELGKGWSHSYQSSLTVHSDTGAALGTATPRHAASLITAVHAVGDLVDSPTSPTAWVVASIAADWGLGQIRDNTVTLAMGRRTLPFTRLADGSFLPPPGMTATLTQGAEGYTLEERFDVVADFGAGNKLTSITDADGHQMAFAYHSSGPDEGKLDTVTDHYGRTLSFIYTGGQLSQVADSTGRSVQFAYDGERLTGVTDPEGHTTQYAYDAEDRIETFINKKGEIIAHNTYDALGRVSHQKAEDDSSQEWEYAFTGVLNAEINPDREFLTYTFDEKGRTIATINGAGDTTRMSYDGQNQLTRIIDPRGNHTRFEHDARNNLRFTYDARNGPSDTTYKIERQYDAHDRMVKLIDEAGHETVYEYDARHRLEKVTDPLLREISYGYYSSGPHEGLIETLTTPGATAGQTHVTTTLYDANGYPNLITRPDTSVVSQAFNARGDLLFAEVITPGEVNTYPVTNTYDLNRRLKTTEDDLGFGVAINYDEVGNTTSTTDRFGNTSTATYSPLARLQTATGPDGQTTVFGHDDSGRRSSITNPLGQISLLSYDSAGRLETTSNPLSETVIQSYDPAGNRTGLQNARLKDYSFSFTANNLQESIITPLNRVFNYTYDDRLLLESVEEPSSQTVTYHYYDDGLLEQTVDPTGTIDFAYDSKGRLQIVTEGNETLTRSYDSLDRVTGFTDSQGNTIGYEHDGGDNLTKLTYPGSKGDVTYEYDNAGRLVKVSDWANRETEFFYDANSRLAEIHLPNGTKREFFYDFAGRVERQTDTHTASGIVLLDQHYEFDALNRIVEERVSPEPAIYVIELALMTYDDDDRITNWQSGAANISPVFDDDGNMTTGVLEGAAETFIYDSRNRLEQAGTTIYTYDSEDRRISKTEGGVTTNYMHDPHAPLSRLLQKTKDGVTTYYVYAGGQLLYEEIGGQITAYHFDSRGSTLAMSDSTGTVINRITYGAYGEIVATMTTPTTPFLYNGAYGVQTDENGLLHMRARYYSTELRRFLNADPIGFGGGMNWYAYANGNPLMFIDPSGLSAWSDYWGEVGQVFLGYGDAAVGTVQGIATAVAHPIQTAQGVASAVAHPIQTYNAISSSVGELSQTSRGQGRMVGEILLTVASGGAAKATSVAGRSSKLTQVTRWGKPGLEAGDWVMTGGKTKLNYALSGKGQRGFGNQFADFDSGSSFNVPAGDLYRPSGLNPIDGRIKSLIPGQRTYNPSGQGIFSYGESSLFNTARLGGIK
jgi:RHS repeat-associated protein